MLQRDAVPDEQQVDHQFMSSRITPVALEAVALDAEESYLSNEEEQEDKNSNQPSE